MTRSVLISDKADQELRKTCAWWSKHRSPDEAERWYDKSVDRLLSLAEDADQQAIAQETHAFSTKVYQVNFGLGRKPTHRALYIIRGSEVIVLRIRHLAQREISERELFGD